MSAVFAMQQLPLIVPDQIYRPSKHFAAKFGVDLPTLPTAEPVSCTYQAELLGRMTRLTLTCKYQNQIAAKRTEISASGMTV